MISKENAFFRNAVDVRSPAHHAVRVSTDVPHSNVVTEDHDDVGLRLLLSLKIVRESHDHRCCDHRGHAGGKCSCSHCLSPINSRLAKIAQRWEAMTVTEQEFSQDCLILNCHFSQ